MRDRNFLERAEWSFKDYLDEGKDSGESFGKTISALIRDKQIKKAFEDPGPCEGDPPDRVGYTNFIKLLKFYQGLGYKFAGVEIDCSTGAPANHLWLGLSRTGKPGTWHHISPSVYLEDK